MALCGRQFFRQYLPDGRRDFGAENLEFTKAFTAAWHTWKVLSNEDSGAKAKEWLDAYRLEIGTRSGDANTTRSLALAGSATEQNPMVSHDLALSNTEEKGFGEPTDNLFTAEETTPAHRIPTLTHPIPPPQLERKRRRRDNLEARHLHSEPAKRARILDSEKAREVLKHCNGVKKHSSIVLALVAEKMAEEATDIPNNFNPNNNQQPEAKVDEGPFSDACTSQTRLLVTITTQPRRGAVSVPLYGCHTMEQLFNIILSEEHIARYVDDEVDKMTVTFRNLRTPRNPYGQSQHLRRGNQADWVDFCDLVQSSWRTNTVGRRHKIEVLIHAL